ncbi:hypothetical protein [Streptomyces sp. NPDC020965]|uniref:hypothetical protein n=1 Tax=Streptomyces sp. NPDC020965 TaxID=3365105 RepID=UPI00379DA1E8
MADRRGAGAAVRDGGVRDGGVREGGVRDAPQKPAASEGSTSSVGGGRGFASASLPRHLARGAVGFGALAGAVLLLPVTGPGSLLLAPVGLLALRGCPMCWAIGLVRTVSMGRLRSSCADGRCELGIARTDHRPD